MNEIKVFKYNETPISFGVGDNIMVNATEMAKPFGKLTKDFLKTDKTKEYIAALSEGGKILSSDLVKVTYGNNGGTWFHEDLAMEFARWLSPAFSIWCNKHIKELLTKGQTSLSAPQSFAQALYLAAQQQEEIEKQQKLLEKKNGQIEQLNNTMVELRKKTDYLDVILQNKSTLLVTGIAQDYGMSAKAFNKELAALGIQLKVGGQWILYSQYVGKGYVHAKQVEIIHSDGSKSYKLNTEWTQRGRIFLYETLKKKGILPLIEQE